MRAVDSGDEATAKPLLEKLRRRDPHNFFVNESLGLIYAGEGKVDAALPLLSAAAKERPTSDAARANLGTAYLKLGQTGNAITELQKATLLNPKNSATQEALGQAYMILKRPKQAASAFNAALLNHEANADLIYNAALAFFQSGQVEKAESLLASMPNVDRSADAQSLYGDVEETLKRYKTAGEHYASAARLAPTESNLYLFAVELLRHWTFDPAAKEFDAGTKKFPESTRMRFGLGIAYYAGGNFDKAIPIFEALLKAHPENEDYAELLGRSCASTAEGDRSECSALVGFSEKHPENARLATYAATSILHKPSDTKQLEIARRLLRRAIQVDPALPQARYAIGLLLQHSGEWKQSIPELQQAIRLKPDYASAHYRLALAFSHVGQPVKAQSEIALEQRYSRQETVETEARLRSVTTFLVNTH